MSKLMSELITQNITGTVYNMLVTYNSREWFRVENPVLSR